MWATGRTWMYTRGFCLRWWPWWQTTWRVGIHGRRLYSRSTIHETTGIAFVYISTACMYVCEVGRCVAWRWRWSTIAWSTITSENIRQDFNHNQNFTKLKVLMKYKIDIIVYEYLYPLLALPIRSYPLLLLYLWSPRLKALLGTSFLSSNLWPPGSNPEEEYLLPDNVLVPTPEPDADEALP